MVSVLSRAKILIMKENPTWTKSFVIRKEYNLLQLDGYLPIISLRFIKSYKISIYTVIFYKRWSTQKFKSMPIFL